MKGMFFMSGSAHDHVDETTGIHLSFSSNANFAAVAVFCEGAAEVNSSPSVLSGAEGVVGGIVSHNIWQRRVVHPAARFPLAKGSAHRPKNWQIGNDLENRKKSPHLQHLLRSTN
jgi:hypothetical protein